MEISKDILVAAESAKGRAVPLSFELLGLGRQLVSQTGGKVVAVTIGDAAGQLPSTLIARGADQVFVLPDAGVTQYYQSDIWLAVMTMVLGRITPRLILMGHNALGADLGPRIAFRAKTAIATGCERVTIEENKLLATRPCYGNKAREILSLRGTSSIATVRAKTIEPLEPDASRQGEIVILDSPKPDSSRTARVIARAQENTGEGMRLENANIIVAGGRGLGGAEGFKVLEQLATVLDGAVGASRVACDLGWCPHSWQIGLTGKTVTPALYIAVGISGASHHMAGCGNAKSILAINSDLEAAIFKEARFGIVGDYKEVIPAIADEIIKRKG